MEISVNGENTAFPDELTATGLVEHLDLTGKRIAMEVNGEIIPRSGYPEHTFRPGDRVEIVHAIGGG